MIAGTPLQRTRNFILQGLAGRQLREETQLAPETYHFDPGTHCLKILDAPSFQSGMSRFMNDRGSELLKRHRLAENVTFIEGAGVQ